MTLFSLACLLVIGAALAAEAWHPKGVLVLPPAVWHVIIGGMGLWMLFLEA